MLTDEQLNEIKARADAATPGVWGCRQAGGRPGVWVNGCKVAAVEAPNHPPATQFYGRRDNAEFIAHAREDIPLLLVEVEQLKAQNAALEAALSSCREAFEAMHPSGHAKGGMVEELERDDG